MSPTMTGVAYVEKDPVDPKLPVEPELADHPPLEPDHPPDEPIVRLPSNPTRYVPPLEPHDPPLEPPEDP